MFLAVVTMIFFSQVIQNPDTEGKMTIQFFEDLRFGAEGGENYEWFDGQTPVVMDVSPNGYMYVVDMKESRVVEFNEKGEFTRIVGKRGEGPGEYQNLGAFRILADGTAIGRDNLQALAKFYYFDKDMKYIDTKLVQDLQKIIVASDISPNGDLMFCWLISVNTETGNMTFRMAFLDSEFNEVRTMVSGDWPRQDPSRFNDSEYWVDNLAGQFNAMVAQNVYQIGFLPDGSTLILDSKKYTIEKWSKNLEEKLAVIQKNFTPKPSTQAETDAMVENLQEIIFSQGGNQFEQILTESVLRRAIEKADLPKVQFPALAVTSIGDKHFGIVSKGSLDTGEVTFDLFQNDGKFIGKAAFPGTGVYGLFGLRVLFKNGFAYAMEKNEDGDNQVVRYRYDFVKR